ncbi:Uncharacterized protein HZ326_26577 [Fusarium oxysporum f. sp. albedinis]|nr:Uncharacterized protein HZ326_26577 [Fusarium oxysporum f. sp. albedinis]
MLRRLQQRERVLDLQWPRWQGVACTVRGALWRWFYLLDGDPVWQPRLCLSSVNEIIPEFRVAFKNSSRQFPCRCYTVRVLEQCW